MLSFLNSSNVVWFAAYAVGVSVLEACAYAFGGPCSVVASRVWLLSGALVLALSLRQIVLTLWRDWRERFAWGWVAVVLLAVVACWRINSFSYYINGEAADEVAFGLQSWTHPDLDYLGTGHWHPARQYLLAALIPKLFGRTLVALRGSFLWSCCTALLLLYAGLREYLRGTRNGAYVAALAIPSLLSFPFVVLWIRTPEQALMPLTTSAAFLGWYFLTMADPQPLTALCLSWTGAMLTGTYTPGLAAWGLGLVLLILAMVHSGTTRRRTTVLLLLVVVVMLSFGFVSLVTRHDFTRELYQSRRGSLHDIWVQVLGGYTAFVSTSIFPTLTWDGYSFMSSAWLIPLALYAATSLGGLNGAFHFVVSLWALSMVGLSVYVVGYGTGSPTTEMYLKTLVVISPFVAGALVRAGELSARWTRVLSVVTLSAFFWVCVGCSLWNLHDAHAWLDAKERRNFDMVEAVVRVAGQYNLADRPLDIYTFSSHYDFGVTE